MVSRLLLGIGNMFMLIQFDSDVLFLLDSIGILLTVIDVRCSLLMIALMSNDSLVKLCFSAI